MDLITIVAAVGLLIFLIAVGKVHPFIAFLLAALFAALLIGMPLATILASLERGIGDMLGSIVPIVVLGAMFGSLIASSGAATRIARTAIACFGERRLSLALSATGFIVGIPLYYNVGFVLLIPLIFSLVRETGRPPLTVGVPLLAGLSIAHGFLPPHPSPSALVVQFGADLGVTLMYGIIVGEPTLLIAGPLLATTLHHIAAPGAALFEEPEGTAAARQAPPGAATSILSALLPVLLIALTTALGYAGGLSDGARAWIAFLGSPTIVFLGALAVITVLLGTRRGLSVERVMDGYAGAARDVSMTLLILGGAGALKQVLVDGGVSAQIGAMLAGLPLPPLVLGWVVAASIRTALGSSTIAGVTAAGLLQPLVQASGVDPNMMVLAIGAGSLMFSHVNDAGFWLFKTYFGLSLRDTFRSWTVLETLAGSCGLVFTLLLDAAVH
jgi:gluconate transporter